MNRPLDQFEIGHWPDLTFKTFSPWYMYCWNPSVHLHWKFPQEIRWATEVPGFWGLSTSTKTSRRGFLMFVSKSKRRSPGVWEQRSVWPCQSYGRFKRAELSITGSCWWCFPIPDFGYALCNLLMHFSICRKDYSRCLFTSLDSLLRFRTYMTRHCLLNMRWLCS